MRFHTYIRVHIYFVQGVMRQCWDRYGSSMPPACPARPDHRDRFVGKQLDQRIWDGRESGDRVGVLNNVPVFTGPSSRLSASTGAAGQRNKESSHGGEDIYCLHRFLWVINKGKLELDSHYAPKNGERR